MSRPIVEYQLPPTTYIYCLTKNNVPFYVGKTTMSPLKKRLYGHLRHRLLNEGEIIEIRLLYKCKGWYEPFRKEIFFINKLRKQGFALTNRNLINKKVPCK